MIDEINLSPKIRTNQNEESCKNCLRLLPECKKPISAMQWFFLIFLAFWTIVTMVAAVVAFVITKEPLSFSLFSIPAYILSRIAKYLFPKDVRDYEIAALKIRYRRKSRKSTDW